MALISSVGLLDLHVELQDRRRYVYERLAGGQYSAPIITVFASPWYVNVHS